MPIPCLAYELRNGYVHNWLLAGPQAIPVSDLERFQGQDTRLQIARFYYTEEPGVARLPVERETHSVGGVELTWEYFRCGDDHFVDLSAFYRTCHYLRAWAYARVAAPRASEVTCTLTTNGPADVWLNGQHVHRHEHFHHQIPHSISFTTAFCEGENEILVRFEEVAMRECPYAMALRLEGLSSGQEETGPRVLLPTSIQPLERRQTLERVFEAGYLDRDVYAWDDEITVRWPDQMPASAWVAARLQTPSGRIYAEAPRLATNTRKAVSLSRAYQVPEGPYHVVLMPPPKEYHQRNMRVQRRIPLWAVRNRYSEAPYGTYQERRLEALQDAARREHNVFSEIAKMALGRWSEVRADAVMSAIEGINRREDCSDFNLAGLLGMMHRYRHDPSFPQALLQPLEECILGFRYWMDEPGNDAMCFWSENHQILFHTCEILAGQLYPERTFSNAGQDGRWHREKGERMALSWLRKRASGGFREWDSNCYFEEDLLALSHLADLAENPQVYDLAAVVTDKLLFTMALNSFKGAFGSTHGRTYAPLIKGARLEATAGIGRLLWGMGAFNDRVLGTVGLACAESYELPPIIAAVAADLPEEMWDRERHAGELAAECDRATGRWEVNKVTYKTPDYMLCSAQDYRPGEFAYQEHIWQATMGPDAVVFVNHPPCVSEEGSHRPNFWHGNVVLPRVAQWRDLLVAIFRLPENDWLGFTHAYFPVCAFDEHALRQGWAFARKGQGYLALTAARGLELITSGNSAYRELRSYGSPNVWLCQMGRAAADGSFSDFQARVLAMGTQLDGLSARLVTLRGESLAFGWEGPLEIDGRAQPITGFRHYENPYCVADLPCSRMEIQLGEDLLRLSFE
ncbi:MAG: hypothetical protein QME94_00875 [Anaerolineae bacterium]|nr:hypothetical protein [Anaerolineae bacterium]